MTIALCLLALNFAVALICAAGARAAEYKMVLCAGGSGPGNYQVATNTAYAKYPNGIFSFENHCGPAPDPAGNYAFLRLADIAADGTSAAGAYGSISWTVSPWVTIRAAGGYIREPAAFNDGWRARFWGEGWDGSTNNFLMQGAGVANGSLGGIGWAPCSTFCSHLWPFGWKGSYRRFVFEVTCYRPAGCDRSGSNIADANSFVLILDDPYPLELWFTNTSAPLLSGRWVKGNQTATYSWSDRGSGVRMEWINIDGARQFTIDHWNECSTGSSGVNGQFALTFQPCATASNVARSDTVNTAALADGAHTLQACGQDYGQWQGLGGTGGATCHSVTIRTDNTPPGAPSGLRVQSSNPARYLSHFGASFSLPPNAGSPIKKVHYDIVNAAGKVVVPEKVVSGTNPTGLADISGPSAPGDYRLRVWLEDEVGFTGALATTQVPHDTTPPAAPQDLTVVGPTSWGPAQGYRLRWRDVPDNGSPIVAAHYQVLDEAGGIVEQTKTVDGEDVEAVANIETPRTPGNYKVRVWLTDGEGNVGAAASAPIPHDTTPPAAPQDLTVVGPTSWGPAQGYRLRWRDVPDNGSPIVAAHYQVLDEAGGIVEQTKTVDGEDVQAVPALETPRTAGNYKVRVWLTDQEGNVGAAASAPIPRDTTPPAAPQGLAVTPPGVSRAAQGFDLRWHDVPDNGSPIVAAHYQVLNAGGQVVVPTQTVRGENVEALHDLQAPSQRGTYTLRLWLEDAEGNVGVAATAPLAYECVRSEASGGSALSSGLGSSSASELVVRQGRGSTLSGRLIGPAGAVGEASICVFSRVVTDQSREFLGVAMSDPDGDYRFAVPAGPSRELSAVYRSGSREVSSHATLETIVHPVFKVRRKVVFNKHYAKFTGRLPRPHNDRVVVVAQVRRGKGWLAFHRYRTRANGHVTLVYRFNKTYVPTKYRMRLQVRSQSGYPYLQGNSSKLTLIVLPSSARRRHRRLRGHGRRLASHPTRRPEAARASTGASSPTQAPTAAQAGHARPLPSAPPGNAIEPPNGGGRSRGRLG